MVEMIIQAVIIGIWSTTLGIHTRRLLRLAQVETVDSLRNHPLRRRLNRVWWWLGREEFWRHVQTDCMHCVQLTLMVFLMAWGIVG